MERLLSKATCSLNLLVQGVSRISLNQTRSYNTAKYITKKKRMEANKISEKNFNWTKTLFEGMDKIKAIDFSEPHMLHVVTRVKTAHGRPWWEKNIIEELGLKGRGRPTVVLKNIEGVNQMLDEVKHLVIVQPLKTPFGLPTCREEFKSMTLKSNGELVFQKYLECQVENPEIKENIEAKVNMEAIENMEVSENIEANKNLEGVEKKAVPQNPVKIKKIRPEKGVMKGPQGLGIEWVFRKKVLQCSLSRKAKLYRVNLEQFPTAYKYKRNQDGKMYRYNFNKNVRKHAL